MRRGRERENGRKVGRRGGKIDIRQGGEGRYLNSLPTNDAYMRHEILYAKRPMTHIRVMTNDRSLTAKLHSREIPTLNIGVIMN